MPQVEVFGVQRKERKPALKILAVSLLFVLVAVACGLWAFNYLSVDRPLQNVLTADSRNRVVSARAHFGGWIDTNALVFDLTDVSAKAARIDVFRVFLQYAEAMKNRRFATVVLAARGKEKFTLDGSYFQELGNEYATQNPLYITRTFPTHLAAMDGTKPYSEYEGGILSVLQKEIEQFTEFSDAWYGKDFAAGESTIMGATPEKSEATFDPCESVRDANPHCGWTPHWEDSGVSTSAIDGTKTEYLSMESTDADGVDFGNLHYAELRICFENGKLCSGTRVSVGVSVHGMVSSESYESEYSTAVRLRFDDEKPLSQSWGIADSHDALFPSGREKQFLTQLMQHKTFVLEFSYYEKVPRTVTFDVSGLAEKMKELNLVVQ